MNCVVVHLSHILQVWRLRVLFKIRLVSLTILIKPVYIDPFTKYRYFTEDQARQFLRLRLLHDFHIPLNKLQEIVKTNKVREALEKELKKFKEQMLEQKKRV